MLLVGLVCWLYYDVLLECLNFVLLVIWILFLILTLAIRWVCLSLRAFRCLGDSVLIVFAVCLCVSWFCLFKLICLFGWLLYDLVGLHFNSIVLHFHLICTLLLGFFAVLCFRCLFYFNVVWFMLIVCYYVVAFVLRCLFSLRGCLNFGYFEVMCFALMWFDCLIPVLELFSYLFEFWYWLYDVYLFCCLICCFITSGICMFCGSLYT